MQDIWELVRKQLVPRSMQYCYYQIGRSVWFDSISWLGALRFITARIYYQLNGVAQVRGEKKNICYEKCQRKKNNVIKSIKRRRKFYWVATKNVNYLEKKHMTCCKYRTHRIYTVAIKQLPLFVIIYCSSGIVDIFTNVFKVLGNRHPCQKACSRE